MIFGEPQPWNILAGVPDRRQARTLVAGIRASSPGWAPRPRSAARRGSARRCRPRPPTREVGERVGGPGIGGGNAVFVGGVWYAINGWLTWALGELDGVVPRAGAYALDELERNTLAAHAAAFPRRWNGVLSVDDACNAWFAQDPGDCGIDLDHTYAGQIMHQPAWTLYAATRLAGIAPTARGYRFPPRLPLRRFSLRLPRVGIEVRPGSVRGYVRPSAGGPLEIEVARPGRGRVTAWAEGRRVPSSVRAGLVRFRLPRAPAARLTSRSRLLSGRRRARVIAAVGARGQLACSGPPPRPPIASRCAPTRTCSGRRADWLDAAPRGLPRPGRQRRGRGRAECTSMPAARRAAAAPGRASRASSSSARAWHGL